MARAKIDLPESFSFCVPLTVRITDLNYGSHVGNDSVLSFLHQARVEWLQSYGYSELDMGGVGMIMADAILIFKNEMYFGDELLISVRAVEFSRVGFDLIYKVEKKTGEKLLLTAVAKTAMISFDYANRKVTALPEEVTGRLSV